MSSHDLDAPGGEACDRVVRGNGGDDAGHVGTHAGPVDARRIGVDAEAVRVAHGLRVPCRRDQRLGGHATGVEAFATHPVRLDQRHGEAEPGEAAGRRQAGRAGADHDDVVRICDAPLPSSVFGGRRSMLEE